MVKVFFWLVGLIFLIVAVNSVVTFYNAHRGAVILGLLISLAWYLDDKKK